MELIMHFSSLLWTIAGIHPHTFDANPRTAKGPLVDITITSPGERVGANV